MWAKFSKLALIKNKLRAADRKDSRNFCFVVLKGILYNRLTLDVLGLLTVLMEITDAWRWNDHAILWVIKCGSLSYFFMYTFQWFMPAFVNMFVVPPGWKIKILVTPLHATQNHSVWPSQWVLANVSATGGGKRQVLRTSWPNADIMA